MSSKNQPSSELWNECQTGDVGSLVSHLRRRKKTRRLVQSSIAVGVVVMLFAVGFTLSQYVFSPVDSLLEGAGSQHAGICCEKVQHYSKDYLAGTVDTDIAHKINGHLILCDQCRSKFDTMKNLLNTSALLLPFEQFALLQ